MPHPLIFLQEEELIKLDSAAFTDKEFYIIGDRSNSMGEKPVAKISLITTEKYGPQIRIAICGDHHKEKLSKFNEDPKIWTSWGWIIIPIEELERIAKILNKWSAFLHFRNQREEE